MEFQCQDVIDNRIASLMMASSCPCGFLSRDNKTSQLHVFFWPNSLSALQQYGFLTDSEEVQYWSGYASWLKVVNVWACKN